MAELEEEEEPTEVSHAEADDLQFLLSPGDEEAATHYQFSHLTVEFEDGQKTFNFIAIAKLFGGVLAAFSKSAWHKTTARRELPRGALSKPILVEAVTALGEDPGVSLDAEHPIKVWIGYLDPALVASALPGRQQLLRPNLVSKTLQMGS